MKLYLVVPYAQKEEAKRLGARWDPTRRQWYVPENVDPVPLLGWLPDDGLVRLAVMLVERLCHKCRRRISCVVGIRLPEELGWAASASIDIVPYIQTEWCGAVLEPLLDDADRQRLAIGPLEERRTGNRPEGYVANTCVHWGAVQGAFHVDEQVDEFLKGDPARVPELWRDGVEVDIPLRAIKALALAGD